MTSFLAQNKSLLTFYEKAARIVGWILLAGGLIWFLAFIFWILAQKDAAGDLVDRILPVLRANTVYAITAFLNDFALPLPFTGFLPCNFSILDKVLFLKNNASLLSGSRIKTLSQYSIASS